MSTTSPRARQELVTAVAERVSAEHAGRERVDPGRVRRAHRVPRRGRRSVYDEAVTEGLVMLWEASDRVCGKRFKALLPTLVPAPRAARRVRSWTGTATVSVRRPRRFWSILWSGMRSGGWPER